MHQLAGGLRRVLLSDPCQCLLAEWLLVCVRRFHKTVGEQEQLISGSNPLFALAVNPIRERAQDRAVCRKFPRRSVAANQPRGIMPGIAVGQSMILGIERTV